MSGKGAKRARRDAAAQREAHTRLVIERQGDHRFIQRVTTEDSIVYQFPDGSEATQDVQEGFELQRQAFREKFGREMGPDDPVFFDPDADEPIPLSEERWKQSLDEIAVVARDAGIDPAYFLAMRDLGYIVSEANQHLFTAHEVQAYDEAVRRYQDVAATVEPEPSRTGADAPPQPYKVVAVEGEGDPAQWTPEELAAGIARAAAMAPAEAAAITARWTEHRCAGPACTRRQGQMSLTPRSAYTLEAALDISADGTYDDVEELGDDPVDLTQMLRVLHELPPMTWREGTQWRRQFARAFDDLAADVRQGRCPEPRCVAEQVALLIGLGMTEVVEDDEGISEDLVRDLLPVREGDGDWAMYAHALIQNANASMLFDASLDGFEDPSHPTNQSLDGDMRPTAWFTPFANAEPRDPHRGFRR